MQEMTIESAPPSPSAVRSTELLHEHEQTIFRRTDRMFAALLVLQWIAGIGAALWISPRSWAGTTSETHVHVWAALFLGGAIAIFPVLLAVVLPGRVVTRHVIAVGQMLASALLIHLTGGRIETHFHVFGSLAFLAFYRDWRVIITASVVVAADHILRGFYWPQSVYGVLAIEPWRWIEHAGWVVFEDCFLVLSIVQSRREMADIANRQANLEAVNETVERQVDERTTELRVSEAALRVALDKARESDRLKSEFLASMSHEIRTPLNGVIGMTGLLVDTDLSPEQREYAETTRASADALLNLINDILDFSKIEVGKLSIEPIPFNLEVAAEEVVELFGSKAGEKKLNLVLRYAPDAPSAVIGDPGRVRQVLTNLVGNAIKFTDSGHVFVNVECERREEGAWFRFSVEDTGIGISEEKQGRIFERFIQADSSTTRKYGGTGLGLAISKQLVELMGGEIGVRTRVGQGSTFWFTLPLPLDPDKQTLPAAPASDLSNVRVLIVDDNAVNRRVLHELVLRWGMRNDSFSSAEEALSALRRARSAGDPFQIALIDLNMPVVDGEMLARAVKSDATLRDTVLLLLTSSGQRGDVKRMAEAGFAAYLTKPVIPSVLMDALSTAWATRSQRQEAVLITRHNLAEQNRPAVAADLKQGSVVRARVLVVEDNIVNQKVASLLLERLGCRVDAAANGKEAVDMTERVPYDLVLMDCQMPEMDGYEATQEIRRREDGARHLPIVAMTAHAMAGAREKCLAVGMDDYLSKPVRREALQTVLERWLRPAKSPEAALPEPPAHPSAEAGVDPEMTAILKDLREDGGEEFVAKLVETFVGNTRQRIVSMHRALTSEDGAAVERLTHDLIGAAGTIGALRLARLCRDLETSVRSHAFGEAAAVLERMDETFEKLESSLAP